MKFQSPVPRFDPRNDQLPVALIAQLVEHYQLNFPSGLSHCFMHQKEKNCEDCKICFNLQFKNMNYKK